MIAVYEVFFLVTVYCASCKLLETFINNIQPLFFFTFGKDFFDTAEDNEYVRSFFAQACLAILSRSSERAFVTLSYLALPYRTLTEFHDSIALRLPEASSFRPSGSSSVRR